MASVVLAAIEAGAAVGLGAARRSSALVGRRLAGSSPSRRRSRSAPPVGPLVDAHGSAFVPPVGATRPLPRARWTTFAIGVTAPHEERRPAGDQLAPPAGPRAGPSGVDGSPSRRV